MRMITPAKTALLGLSVLLLAACGKPSEPAAAATPVAAAQTPATQTAASASISASAAAATSSAAVALAAPLADDSIGRTLYQRNCFACHDTAVAGAPRMGDKVAWAPRLAKGKDMLYSHALNGLNAMPAKGGSGAPDAEVKAAVDYMLATVQ